jgi:hypothetical protein
VTARALATFALLALLALPSRARAERTAEERSAIADDDRPHTLAQLGIGLLTIPGADVCLKDRPCTKGDTSIAMEFWQMYRANRYFAVGAGTSIAVKPTVDYPPNLGGIERAHTRGYFSVEAQVRYYALRLDVAEAWLGASGGGVVVSDRYTIEDNKTTFGAEPAIIGPRQNTVRTEGLTVAAILGGQWMLAPSWGVGATFRYARWLLPSKPATTSFLDRATLTNSQGVLYIGITAAYRIAL